LERATFTLGSDQVAAYLRSIGDESDYGAVVPPLALVALALMALQSQIWLPEGSLHTGQEVEHEREARVDESLTLRGRIAQRSERQGYVISVIELEIASSDAVAVRARTTIMAPGGGA
jgi:hypothetical protein